VAVPAAPRNSRCPQVCEKGAGYWLVTPSIGRMRRTISVLGVVAAFLAGCGGSPAPSQPSTSVTTTPPSSSAVTSIVATPTAPRTGPLTTGPNVRPGEKPPALPNLVKERNPNGAFFLANLYFKALDWSIATNDTYLLKAVASNTCSECTRAIDGIDALRTRGRLMTGGRLHIQSARLVHGSFKFRSDFVYQVGVRQDAQRVVDGHGAIVGRLKESTDEFLVFVSWGRNRWNVVEVGRPG
jgi:hypothetical protein